MRRKGHKQMGLSRVAVALACLVVAGRADSQVFILQGEKGDPGGGLACDGGTCTVPDGQHLVVDGNGVFTGNISASQGTFSSDLEVTGAAFFGSISVDSLTVLESVWLPECPSGYVRDTSESALVLCTKEMPSGAVDEMVKVGDFWIDRFEMSVWQNSDCSGTQYGAESDNWAMPDTGGGSIKAFACSLGGVMPTAFMTWFQAQQSCVAAGKDLCRNGEWQAAATGTTDPGTEGADAQCLLSSGAPRATGGAGAAPGGTDACISYFGAEDMIGNLWEWADDWFVAGHDWAGVDVPQAAYPWPLSFGFEYDLTSNVHGRADTGLGFTNGAPAAALRGGDFASGGDGGIFAISLDNAPSSAGANIGARCCRRR